MLLDRRLLTRRRQQLPRHHLHQRNSYVYQCRLPDRLVLRYQNLIHHGHRDLRGNRHGNHRRRLEQRHLTWQRDT